jgi:hypothetical protein
MEDELLSLTQVFSIDMSAYAIIINRAHTVFMLMNQLLWLV